MLDSQEKLSQLKKLLLIEKAEEHKQYIDFVENSSLTDQIKKGVCWYPISIEKTGYGLGDYPFLVGIRKEVSKDRSFLSGGKPVEVFSDGNVAHGVIHYVNENKLRINFNTNELPSWINKDKLGVRLLFDDTSYIEMQKALDQVKASYGNRIAELREILLGGEKPGFISYNRSDSEDLNDSQNAAVQNILDAKDVAVVHGPPGTGKTTTLVTAIIELAKKDQETVLVCAPSNTAADVLTQRLSKKGANVVRIGNLSRINEEVMNCSLEVLVTEHEYFKDIKKLRQQANQYREMASRYKRNFGKAEREQRKRMRAEANDLQNHANSLEGHIVSQTLDRADAVVCTLVSSNNKYLTHKTFKTLVIDEAAQSLEPACFIPILKADKLILAGDPYQLPPTVKSAEAAHAGLSKTLIERCIDAFPKAVNLLNVQYRMNSKIMSYSNNYFYEGKLQAHKKVIDWQLPTDQPIISFIDTAGSDANEQSPPDSRSLFNTGEYDLIKKHINGLTEAIEGVNDYTVGIISPYKEQVLYIKEDVESSDLLTSMNITVQTIDGFQGQERDIIYISLVRSNTKGEIGFLTDYRRMNVAITRAKKMLVIIGDSATLGNDPFYSGLIDHIEKEAGYVSCWEFA